MPPNTHPGEGSALLENRQGSKNNNNNNNNNPLLSLFQKPPETPFDENVATTAPKSHQHHSVSSEHGLIQEQFAACANESLISTLTGSFTFLLYHVVYCLAQASTITRPHAGHSSVGVMAKIAAVGTFFAGPVFVWELGLKVPAIYPSSDLFLSPFLAQVAADIDASLYEHGLENNDRVFLATFGALIGAGFLASGLLCILAARVKLANLGSFLPYCVLCGFFTTIGILIWSLGFSVDTGIKVGELFDLDPAKHGDSWTEVLGKALLHHFPSLTIGIIMHLVAQKNSLYVISLVFASILGAYGMLWATGTSLERAQELNWFFSAKELQVPPFLSSESQSWFESWTSPAPFGVMVMLFHGDVHWPSFRNGLSTMSALAFLYLIRCSVHSAALKKNIPNVTRKMEEPPSPTMSGPLQSLPQSFRSHRNSSHTKAHKDPVSLGKILECGYGYSQLVAAFTGGITVAPAVAASLTLFKLGCEGVAPQYGSFLLVVIFYLTDFQLVQYIPKPAVSCLMVLAGLDMCKTWLYDSYFKTKAKLEWMVAPLIVVLAFSVGMLNAIFLGVALSTFIFVANFYKAGTVKFVGTGLNLRSTVERGVPETNWLTQHGDLINILVLSNYIFFGNGQSVYNYIMTMFEDPAINESAESLEQSDATPLPPKPRYVIIDFTLVTGMDTSAVDIIREILVLCRGHGCKLFLSGLSSSLKSMLVYAKLTPAQEKRTLLFAPDLESALAKAEDGLINRLSPFGQKDISESQARFEDESTDPEEGFIYALEKISEQHGLINILHELRELSQYVIPVEVGANEVLPWEHEAHHGLFFIEYGILRIEHGADHTTNRTFPSSATRSALSPQGANPLSNMSIGHLNARSGTIGRQSAMLKEAKGRNGLTEQSFRLARVGQGWVVGMIENCSGMRRVGVYVAATPCRLHHLKYETMMQIEKTNPNLMMNLYKLMSHLSTKRQEMTIAQLAQFVSIMHSPNPKEPISRAAR